ncbi:hypothetical protein ACFPRL_25955 [Pseudoclavibacter helvolus]
MPAWFEAQDLAHPANREGVDRGDALSRNIRSLDRDSQVGDDPEWLSGRVVIDCRVALAHGPSSGIAIAITLEQKGPGGQDGFVTRDARRLRTSPRT